MEVAMPARSALVPKYCLHKPSGRAYVRIQGKVVYVGRHGSADSKQEYGRLVAELAVNPLPLPVLVQGRLITNMKENQTPNLSDGGNETDVIM
jgi:hypothetical protein